MNDQFSELPKGTTQSGTRRPALKRFRASLAGIAPASLSALFGGLLVTNAQSYSIGWHKVSAGGGASSGGPYTIAGTIGQHDASGPITGGNYSLTGGFWSLVSSILTPGAPLLTSLLRSAQYGHR